MADQKLRVKTMGLINSSNRKPKFYENIAYSTIFLEKNSGLTFITVDVDLINNNMVDICDAGNFVFHGTWDELVAKLSK